MCPAPWTETRVDLFSVDSYGASRKHKNPINKPHCITSLTEYPTVRWADFMGLESWIYPGSPCCSSLPIKFLGLGLWPFGDYLPLQAG